MLILELQHELPNDFVVLTIYDPDTKKQMSIEVPRTELLSKLRHKIDTRFEIVQEETK